MGDIIYNEIDSYACAWLRNLAAAEHISPGHVFERSINDLVGSDLAGVTQFHAFAGIGGWSYALRLAGWPDDLPVWTGSCPCQPFSVAGKGKGLDDERHLWPEWLRLIKECRPSTIFGEQVASPAGRTWLDNVSLDLEALGYAVGSADLCAASVGAPHIRQRLWFVAYADGGQLQRKPKADGGNDPNRPHAGRPQGDSVFADDSRASELAYADGISGNKRSQDTRRRAQGSHAQQGSRLGGGSRVGELGNSCGPGLAGRASEREDNGQEQPASERASGAVRGFWADAEWIPCRDGKARPVEPVHVKMVDGISSSVGCLRSEEAEKGKVDAVLQGVQGNSSSKTIQQRGAREPIDVEATKVLQPQVYGGRPSKGALRQSESQSYEISETSKSELRDLQNAGETTRSSQEPRSTGQRTLKLDDVVQLMSRSRALAKLYDDGRTSEGLQALQRTIRKNWVVQHTSKSIQEVWASLSEETKDRLRVGFDATRWELVVPFPLIRASRLSNRVGKLRGYGNAIVPQVAAEFIKAAMEVM